MWNKDIIPNDINRFAKRATVQISSDNKNDP